jgi:hypothetical protein
VAGKDNRSARHHRPSGASSRMRSISRRRGTGTCRRLG